MTDLLEGEAITIDAPGYIIVYVKNNSIGKDVYFDNIKIEHYAGTLLEENHYYPYGLTVSQAASGATAPENPYKYQTIELERNFGLEQYETFFRTLDPQLGIFRQIDPKAEIDYMAPYVSMKDNPTSFTDPKGDIAKEYDQHGIVISNLGGDNIDFRHQQDGNTIIIDNETGETNTITGGESLIRGYALRDGNVSWSTITGEYLTQTGPTNSMFADLSGTSQKGPFSSLHNAFSSYSTPAREMSLSSNSSKGFINMTYKEANPIVANDMWEQMWGGQELTGISLVIRPYL